MGSNRLMFEILIGNLSNVRIEIEERGMSVNTIKDEHSKYSALHFAVDMIQLDIVTYLLEHGADPNIQDSRNYTPLHLAVLQLKRTKCNTDGYIRCTDIIRCLIKHHANVHIKSNYGTSALEKSKEHRASYDIMLQAIIWT